MMTSRIVINVDGYVNGENLMIKRGNYILLFSYTMLNLKEVNEFLLS